MNQGERQGGRLHTPEPTKMKPKVLPRPERSQFYQPCWLVDTSRRRPPGCSTCFTTNSGFPLGCYPVPPVPVRTYLPPETFLLRMPA